MELQIAIFALLACKSGCFVLVGVGPQVNEKRVEGVLGAIGIGEFLICMQKVQIIVKPHIDFVDNFLLKVVRLAVRNLMDEKKKKAGKQSFFHGNRPDQMIKIQLKSSQNRPISYI